MNNSKTILIVDDTETNIDILIGLLDGYDLMVATDGVSAIEIANEERIDLILLDIMMPEMDGYEVCEKLKASDKTKEIPIIFITAKTDEGSIERAYDVGGIDYVTKPFKPKELLARVKTQLDMRSLIDDLNFLASRDSMTGIYNRRKFFELAEKMFEEEKNLFSIMIDIDKFKAINDNYGHPVGDRVIKDVTKTISDLLDEHSLFGRLGGEEFAIICTQTNIKEVERNMEKIRYAVEVLNVITDENESVKITISSGISQKNSTIIGLDHLLKDADDALYEAKNSGRNRSVFRIRL